MCPFLSKLRFVLAPSSAIQTIHPLMFQAPSTRARASGPHWYRQASNTQVLEASRAMMMWSHDIGCEFLCSGACSCCLF